MKLSTITYSFQSIILMIAVMLSSAHAKDVVKGVSAPTKQTDIVKVHGDENPGGHHKVSAELHNHVDKQTLKMFYHGGDIQQQADRRALRVLESEALSLKDEFKVGMSIWLKMLAARLLP